APPSITYQDRAALADELGRAERPLLIVGGPGWSQGVGQAVIAFAERNAVPVATAFRWQDAVDNRSPAYAGYLGLGCSPRLRQAAAEADVVVGFGPRLDDPTTNGYELTERARRLVLLSQSPAELCHGIVPDIGIHCGLASAAEALAASSLDGRAGRRAW